MRNNRYPRYPDDNDYTTNSPSYYDDLARKHKLIQLLAEKIWEYDDEIKEYFRRWEDNLENINEDVILMMIKWFDDGILDQILNEELLNHKPEIYVSEDEPVTSFSNTFWYQDVGLSGLQQNIYKSNVKVSKEEPEDQYNIWLNY